MPKADDHQKIELRLQKVIADCGVTSRRKAELLITAGRVKVNGVVADQLGTKVNPHTDVVEVDHEMIDLMSVDRIYMIFNKPRAVVTTVSDPEGRPTVMEYIRGVPQRVFPVGRLDYLSEGLLIMTNDGDMANMIMHPKFEINKVYEVKVFGHVNEALMSKIRRGVMTEDGLLKPKSVRIIEQLPNKTWLEFRLAEGKNREIRKICESLDLTVDKLRRVAIETLTIQGLAPGQWTFISKKDLLKALGIDEKGNKVTTLTPKFVSAKRTVNIRKASKMVKNTAVPADDKKFQSFRRENYYQTISEMKELALQKQQMATGMPIKE
jgi:23S rRNA pseudouridine2605 synthase